MRLIQTIKNIFKIEDLRQRILYTLGIILLYRFGKYITLPGVDPSQLGNLQDQTASGIMGLLDAYVQLRLTTLLQPLSQTCLAHAFAKVSGPRSLDSDSIGPWVYRPLGA